MRKSPTLHLDRIDRALADIEADLEEHDLESFCADRRTRQSIEHSLGILSRASHQIPEAAKAREREIPWKEIAGISGVLRYKNFKNQPAILWHTCKEDMVPFKVAIKRIRKGLDKKRTRDES